MPKRSDAHMSQRRRQILDAALACFEEEGFEAATMKGIGRRAGLSIGALYTHFKNKRELVLVLLDERNQQRNHTVIASLDEFRNFLAEAALELTGILFPGRFNLNIHMMQLGFSDEEIRKALALSTESNNSLLRRTLVGLRDSGQIRPDYDIEKGAQLLTWLGIGSLYCNFLAGTANAEMLKALFDSELDRMRPAGV